MPTLSQIIEQDALFMKDVTVAVLSNFGTVYISDDSGVHEDIFLQGDDASSFISERERLWDETGNLTRGTIELHLAKAHVENIWS